MAKAAEGRRGHGHQRARETFGLVWRFLVTGMVMMGSPIADGQIWAPGHSRDLVGRTNRPGATSSAPASRDRPIGCTNLRVPPNALDDSALCLAWLDTGMALGVTPSTLLTVGLAEYRRECLDELQRRYPAECVRWLQEGPPAGCDARTYLPPAIHARTR